MNGKALVVGGGPAGASAALGFLRAGYDVTLLEQRNHWLGRVCGAFLDAEAVRHLRWLGVFNEMIVAGATNVPTSVVTTERGTVVRVHTRQAGDSGWGLPRQDLEEILIKSVVRSGGLVKIGTRVLSYQKDGAEWVVLTRDLEGTTAFRAKHLVLSDGRFSSLTGVLPKKRRGWFGWNAAFAGVAQEPGEMSMHFYPGGYVGVLTFRDGTTNVCGLRYQRNGEHEGWDKVYSDALEQQPRFRELLGGARRVSEWRGVGPLPFGRRKTLRGGPVLAGDAAAVGDPFMGEGIGRALGAGPMIFQALEKSGAHASDDIFLREYARLWRESYNARFAIGFWMRLLMGPGPFFGPALEFIIRRPALMHKAMPLFHLGFLPRGRNE